MIRQPFCIALGSSEATACDREAQLDFAKKIATRVNSSAERELVDLQDSIRVLEIMLAAA